MRVRLPEVWNTPSSVGGWQQMEHAVDRLRTMTARVLRPAFDLDVVCIESLTPTAAHLIDRLPQVDGT